MVVQRRLELLKMEGLGFNQAEIVKQLSEKYQCSARAVYFDFERRPSWQPTLLQLSDQEKVLLKVINRYEQIYRQAAFKCLTAANENEPRRLHCNGKKTMVTVFSALKSQFLLVQ